MKKEVKFSQNSRQDKDKLKSGKKRRLDQDHENTDFLIEKKSKSSHLVNFSPDISDQDSDASFTPPSHFAMPTPASSPSLFSVPIQDTDMEDKEFWLLRLPESLPISALNGLNLKFSNLQENNNELHSLNHDNINYSLYQTFHSNQLQPSLTNSNIMMANELSSMQCLLENPNTGHLQLSTQPFTRHFNISQTVDFPTPPHS